MSAIRSTVKEDSGFSVHTEVVDAVGSIPSGKVSGRRNTPFLNFQTINSKLWHDGKDNRIYTNFFDTCIL
tara:strand:+ start:82 stop:291 length:210 start_codon:yes stop_codon:yes gene_type:complete